MSDPNANHSNSPGKLAAFGAVISILVAAVAFALWMFELRTTVDPITLKIVTEHFPAIVGLPLAAVGAFIVVVLLRHTNGPVEFEGLGFRFRGASGPVVMWIACFLVIVISIKILW